MPSSFAKIDINKIHTGRRTGQGTIILQNVRAFLSFAKLEKALRLY